MLWSLRLHWPQQDAVPEGEGLEKVSRGADQLGGGGSRGLRVGEPLEQAQTAPKQQEGVIIPNISIP